MTAVRTFPGLAHADAQAQRAASLLETATHTLVTPVAQEDWGARAQRLRAAAILATTAALEIMNSAGWSDAASEAAAHGLVEERRQR
jgi:hypothetical protein